MTVRASPFADARAIFFSHIQKTGGTTLRRMLADGLPPERVYPNAGDGAALTRSGIQRGPESDAFVALSPVRRAATWLVADHLAPCLIERMPSTPLLVILLRAPVDRALSHLGHVQRYVPAFAERSLADLFEDDDIRASLVADYQVRFLGALDAGEAARPLEPRPVGPDVLARATGWLDRADAIGLTHDFERSARLIGQVVGRPLGPAGRLNAALPRAAAEAGDPALRARVAEAVGLDHEIYDAALRRYRALLGTWAVE